MVRFSDSEDDPNVFASRLRDWLIGWRAADHPTRVRLLSDFANSIGLSSFVSNAAAILVAAWFILGSQLAVWNMAWFVSVAVAGLMPRLYALHLRRDGTLDEAPERKALIFLAINAVYGLLWGLGAVLLLPVLDGARTAMLLVLIAFGTVMGPYAAMPGTLYVRLVTTGGLTLLAIGAHLDTRALYLSLLSVGWLVVRSDVWRGYHRSLREQLELRQALEEATAALDATNRQLDTQATSDPVTGIANRRGLQRALGGLEGPAALILFDIDHFKHINDQWGHAVGDDVLVEVVQRTRDVLRPEDMIARYGGDEIVVVLPGIGEAQARAVAERVRRELCDSPLEVDGYPVPVSASIGLTVVAAGARVDDTDTILHFADAALYEAKASGRNRVARALITDESSGNATVRLLA